MINQATFKFYQVLLDNESGSEIQLLALVEEYCFEAVSAERRHTCYKKIVMCKVRSIVFNAYSTSFLIIDNFINNDISISEICNWFALLL